MRTAPNRFSCDDYRSLGLCSANRSKGNGWNEKRAGDFADYAMHGLDATQACCACGGGTHVDTPVQFITGKMDSGMETDDSMCHTLAQCGKGEWYQLKRAKGVPIASCPGVGQHRGAAFKEPNSYTDAELMAEDALPKSEISDGYWNCKSLLAWKGQQVCDDPGVQHHDWAQNCPINCKKVCFFFFVFCELPWAGERAAALWQCDFTGAPAHMYHTPPSVNVPPPRAWVCGCIL